MTSFPRTFTTADAAAAAAPAADDFGCPVTTFDLHWQDPISGRLKQSVLVSARFRIATCFDNLASFILLLESATKTEILERLRGVYF